MFFKSTYTIGYVRFKAPFNLTKINTLKTRGKVYICVHCAFLAKCTYSKLDIADFQCKGTGKYTLDVNIINLYITSHKGYDFSKIKLFLIRFSGAFIGTNG